LAAKSWGQRDPSIGFTPEVDGHPWRSAEALALVRGAAGEDAWAPVLALDAAVLQPGTIRVGDEVTLVHEGPP